MKRNLYYLFAFIVCIATACTKADVNFGSQFLDNGNTQIVKVDTIQPVLTTVYVDSFTTSGTGVALIGGYTDPYFGVVSSKSYFEFSPPTVETAPTVKAVFDSLTIVLKYNKTFYGDTTQPYSLNVYQLANNILPKGVSTTLFNKDTIPALPGVIGQGTYKVMPNTIIDTISIRLPDAMAATFLQMLQTKDDRISATDKFIDYFKGVCIAPGNSNSCIMGFKDSITMRLYYKEPAAVTTQQVFKFSMVNNTHQFNNISIDRTGTVLGNLNFGSLTKKEIPSTSTNNIAYGQYITGAMPKISFPTLRSLLQANNYKGILQARLMVVPLKNTYTGLYTLPPQLRLSVTDINNQLGSDLAASVNGQTVTQTGNLVIDEMSGQNTSYQYDVTSYLQQQISASPTSQNGLLLVPPSPSHTTKFDRILVGSAINPNSRIQLIIYYLAVQ
ncbi:MAG: DUF4270 family protein [Filimonas sp.]|nr:DUF4270 family protein [Filimonas sp.]